VDKSGNNPVDKPGAGNRATFISPYLRRPIRPLKTVLSDREQESLPQAHSSPANDFLTERVVVEPAGWSGKSKRAVLPK